MKKVIISAVLVCLLALPLVYIGCSNPSGGGRGGSGEVVGKGINAESVVFKLETVGGARYARSLLDIGEVYTLTIIKPRPQNVEGAAQNFNFTSINATVESEPTVNNGRERFAFSRQGGGTFHITFDQNGDIFGVEGLDDTGFLNPIGENRNSLNGVYVGFGPAQDNRTNKTGGDKTTILPYNLTINGNTFGFTIYNGASDEWPEHHPIEVIYTISVSGNTIYFPKEHKVRHQYLGHNYFQETSVDSLNSVNGTCNFQEATFAFVGGVLYLTFTKEYPFEGLHEGNSVVGVTFPHTRVPTN